MEKTSDIPNFKIYNIYSDKLYNGTIRLDDFSFSTEK